MHSIERLSSAAWRHAASDGGLARATRAAVTVLDAAGYDVVLVETIGVGQDEVDILDVADTVVAVVAPGLGDDVQAMKAGLLEVAHIIVLNKGTTRCRGPCEICANGIPASSARSA